MMTADRAASQAREGMQAWSCAGHGRKDWDLVQMKTAMAAAAATNSPRRWNIKRNRVEWCGRGSRKQQR